MSQSTSLQNSPTKSLFFQIPEEIPVEVVTSYILLEHTKNSVASQVISLGPPRFIYPFLKKTSKQIYLDIYEMDPLNSFNQELRGSRDVYTQKVHLEIIREIVQFYTKPQVHTQVFVQNIRDYRLNKSECTKILLLDTCNISTLKYMSFKNLKQGDLVVLNTSETRAPGTAQSFQAKHIRHSEMLIQREYLARGSKAVKRNLSIFRIL